MKRKMQTSENVFEAQLTPRSTESISVRWSAVGLLLGYLVCIAGFKGMPASATGASDLRAKKGAQIFQQRCVACHNTAPGSTAAFGPPSLSGIFRGPSPMTTKEATEIISKGKASMPAWGNVLTPIDIENVIVYLRKQ